MSIASKAKTSQDMTTTTVKILTERLERAIEIIDKINKKADKLGIQRIIYGIGTEQIQYVIFAHKEIKVSYTEITITTQLIKLNEEWKLAGTIEAYGEHNLVNAVPSLSDRLPNTLRSSKLNCEHCQTKRYRKKHIIVINDSNETKIVGTTCVKDFLGHDALSKIKFFQNFEIFFDELCELSEPSDGYGNLQESALNHVVEMAIAVIRSQGWVSANNNSSDKLPTYYEIIEQIFNSNKLKKGELIEVKKCDLDKADTILRRWKEIAKEADEKSNEWDWKKKLIVSKEYVNIKKISLVVGMTYGEILTIQKEKIAEDKSKEVFFGTEKIRGEFDLKIQQVKAIDGYYGYSNLVVGIDTKTGGKFKWFDSKQNDWYSESNVYHVKATVKAHESTIYGNQTVLSRVSLIK